MVVKKLIKELEIGIAEFILLIIIILSFLDAFELLSIEFDYIKKLISWIGLGYLFYKASITNLIVGNKHKHIDWILVIAYFFFMFKDFTGFIVSSFKEAASSNLSSFYYFIISNRHALESYTFYIAGILILLLSIYISKLDIHNKSILYILHEKKKSAKVILF